MIIRLIIPIMSNALPNVELMVTLDFGLIVTPYNLHYFNMSEIVARISYQSIPVVKSLVRIVAEVEKFILGW